MDAELIKNQFIKYFKHILIPMFPNIKEFSIDERNFSIVNDKTYFQFTFYCDDLNEDFEIDIHAAVYDMISYFGYQDSVFFGTEFKTI